MENATCICSVLSLLKGESASETAMFLTKTLWEREKRKVVYVPAGIQFERVGSVSMTELYFSYRKGQDLSPYFAEKKPVVVKPFHCFLEKAEIEEEQFQGFVFSLAKEADCFVASLDGVSSGQLHWFLDNSSMVVVLTACDKGMPSPQFIGFLHNLRLLWGEELGERLKQFLFVLPNAGQADQEVMRKILREEGIFLTNEEASMVFVTEEEIAKQKSVFRKKARENGRGLL